MALQKDFTLIVNDSEGVSDRKQSLWDIDTELDAIAGAYDAMDAEGQEDSLKAAVENYFGDLLVNRDQKLESYARLIAIKEAESKIRKAEADKFGEEAKRLAGLAKSDASLADRLKKRLTDYFVAKGITKIETRFHKFNLQNNGGVRPLKFKEGASASTAADSYVRLVREWDEDAIRAALAAGEKLDFVELAPQAQRVAIR